MRFSKVRALTRLVTMPELEADLVEMAQTATAAQLDSIASAYLRTTHLDSPSRGVNNFEGRQFEYISHDDGTTTLKITAPHDLISTIMTVVDHVVASREREADLSIAQRRVDALLRIASHILEPDSRLPVDATIVIHTEAVEVDSTQANDISAETPPARLNGLPISRAAYERLRCGAKIATERTRNDGTIERTPTADAIPRAHIYVSAGTHRYGTCSRNRDRTGRSHGSRQTTRRTATHRRDHRHRNK